MQRDGAMKSRGMIFFLFLLLTGLVLVFGMNSQPAAFAGGDAPPISLQLVASVDFSPTDIANSGVSGDERLFVVEQWGKIRVLESDGTVLSTPFLDITDRVDGGSEMGLLGLAFAPDYNSSDFFYVNYTYRDKSDDIYSRLSRFSVTGNPDVADPSSELVIMELFQPFANHNGGDLEFGPDGYLYIGWGDGGGINDPDDNSQDMSVLLGKMLRLDLSGGGLAADCDSDGNYTIPADNPLVDGAGGDCDEIWASGLRNPWRFSFDSANGDLYIADVGEDQWEEVNYQPAAGTGGENYGWRCYEGNEENVTTGCGPIGSYDFPVFVYEHTPPPNCAVTGGFVYRGSSYPALQGYYLLADYCSGHIWSLDPANGFASQELLQVPAVLWTTFGEDIHGEMYLGDLASNSIYRIVEPPLPWSYFPLVLDTVE